MDYFSLDVEGAELDVLRSTDFTKVDIKTMSVEYSHVEGGIPGLTSFFKTKGMYVYKKINVVLSHPESFYAKDLILVQDDFKRKSRSLFKSILPKV